MAAIVHEPIAAHDEVLRKHDRRAGGVLREGVVLENISVRIHVVQAVANVVDEIIFDPRIVREGKINPVARLADFVPANQIAFAIPLVNAVTAAIGDQRCVAILRAAPDCLFTGSSESARVVLPSIRLLRICAPETFLR